MSSLQNTSEHFSSISIGDMNDNKINMSNQNDEDGELDLKNELFSLEEHYKTLLKSINEMNLNLDKISLNFNQNKFDKLYAEFKKLKTILTLKTENLQILQETSVEKAKDPEIKRLLENTFTISSKVEKKYSEVAEKIKSINYQPNSNGKNIFDFNDMEEEKNEKKEFDREIESVFYKMEDLSGDLDSISKNSNNDKLQKITKYSSDINKLTSEIKKKMNDQDDQGDDLSKLEELLDDTKIQIRKNDMYSSKHTTDEAEQQSRTNSYLIVWCVGSILIFTLMILLKYVISKSQANGLNN